MSPGPSASSNPTPRVLVAAVVLILVVVAVAWALIHHNRKAETELQDAERIARVEKRETQKAEASDRVKAVVERTREKREQQARVVDEQRQEAEREELARAEQEQVAAKREQEILEQDRRAAEEGGRAQARRLTEEQVRAEEERVERHREEERRIISEREAEQRVRLEEQETARKAAEEKARAEAAEAQALEQDDDDTPKVETESTIDAAVEKKGLRSSGDLRPFYDYFHLTDRDSGISAREDIFGFRTRVGLEWGVTKRLHLGVRLAGICNTADCDLEFVMESAAPLPTRGLVGGQFTFDQLYVHWFRKDRFDLIGGRIQTRFTLRGGVYAKSLDRNDSHNVRVTWTDGIQATFRGRLGWSNHFVVQRNTSEGTGSIRRRPLDFDDSGARATYFYGAENIRSWGLIVQRGIDVSYLPNSLLKDNDPDGRREDYAGLVGRLAMRWPQRSEGLRLRAGMEMGYAPETPTDAAVGLPGTGDTCGLAWDVVISAMDIAPDHHIGINYARTGAGWLLAPQFRPNEELREIRYMWEPERLPLFEARIRQREDLEKLAGAIKKRSVFDLFVRLTWRFTIKD